MRKNNVSVNANATKKYTLEDLKELVIDYKGGNEYSFTIIFKLTSPVLQACGRKQTRDDQVIQDAIQETFITVAKKIAQLESEEKFLGWTRTIFRNKLTDQFRKQKMIKEDSEDASGTEYSSTFVKSVCKKAELNPEVNLIYKEFIKRVEEAINLLPAAQRVALLAYAYDNKSMEEIAYMMECPEGTIKSRLHNARKFVKEYVSE